jgi:drug/metabolite transporter (DMT)-like permease
VKAEGETIPPRAKLIAAFGAVYLIWGSTYLAIRFALETLPPFLMTAARFLLAGLPFYAFARLRGAPRPTPAQWRAASLLGALFFLGGNGAVSWAETRVSSGVAALIVSTIPLWMSLFEFLRGGRRVPALPVLLGLAGGLSGIVILVSPGRVLGGLPIDRLALVVQLGGAFSWVAGSILTTRLSRPENPALAAAMTILSGGVWLAIAGVLMGELSRFHGNAISVKSALAVLYQAVFGSIVAFSAYSFLLRTTTPSRASTYAYVNPVVAVLLGALLGGEALTSRVLFASVVIVASVALIITARSRTAPAASIESRSARR